LLKGLTCDFQVLLCSRFPLDWVRQSSLAGGRAREKALPPRTSNCTVPFPRSAARISGVMYKIHRFPHLCKPRAKKKRDFFRRRGKMRGRRDAAGGGRDARNPAPGLSASVRPCPKGRRQGLGNGGRRRAAPRPHYYIGMATPARPPA